VLALPEQMATPSATVYDGAGRRVRVLDPGRANGTVISYQWDGRDDAGRQVVAGVYYCRVAIGEITIGRKLTVIR
jgi:flagellar hook assembly protein FlgD